MGGILDCQRRKKFGRGEGNFPRIFTVAGELSGKIAAKKQGMHFAEHSGRNAI
jgi:hypothetical protein